MHWILIIVLILIGLSRMERAKGSGASDATPSGADRRSELRRRAAKGASWAVDFREALIRAKIPAAMADPFSLMLARWAGIESGGDPTDVTKKDDGSPWERGVLQIDDETAKAAGLTTDQWKSLSNPAGDVFARAAQCDLSLKYLEYIAKRALGSDFAGWTMVDAALYPDGAMLIVKLFHGLPLLVKELAAQGVLKPGGATAIVERWKAGFKPSDKLIAKGLPKTAVGVYERFGISAEVVVNG